MPADALITPAVKSGIQECLKCMKANIYDPSNLSKIKFDVRTCESVPHITKPLIHTCVQARIAPYITAPCKGACRVIQPQPAVTTAVVTPALLLTTLFDRFALGNSFLYLRIILRYAYIAFNDVFFLFTASRSRPCLRRVLRLR